MDARIFRPLVGIWRDHYNCQRGDEKIVTTEYLPPVNEQTGMTAPGSSEVQRAERFVRIKCSSCSHEVGFTSSSENAYEDALSLVEKLGWRVGHKLLCPRCVEKTVRKFFNKYQ